MSTLKILLNNLPHGSNYLLKVFRVLNSGQVKTENTEEFLVRSLIESDKLMVELQEALIKSKQREIPEDIINGKRKITFSIGPHS